MRLTAQTKGLKEVFDMVPSENWLDATLGRSRMGARDEDIPVNGKISRPSGKSRLIPHVLLLFRFVELQLYTSRGMGGVGMKQSKKVCAVASLLLLVTILAYAQTQYFQFGNLATTAVAVSKTWTEISPTPAPRSFTTNSSADIEIVVNSWFGIGELTTAKGVDFAVRLDGRGALITNFGSVKASNGSAFLSILGYFQNIPAGTHSVSLWALAPAGSASNVIADPGNFGGKIMIKVSPAMNGSAASSMPRPNQTNAPAVNSGTYKTGDRGPAGGYIFYDKGNSDGGWRYLEAAKENLPVTDWRSGDYVPTGASDTAIGTGKANTIKIIRVQGQGTYAASACVAYSGGGFSDWFLPSKDELDALYKNLGKKGIGGFDSGLYWSSSDDTTYQYAWTEDFGSGFQLNSPGKGGEPVVRPIRQVSDK